MNKDLENKILEVADLIYNTGYTAGSSESRPMGFDAGYKYGLNIAWKVAKLEDVFKCKPIDIYGMSVSEALEKIKEFQKKDTCSRCVHNKCNTCVHKNEDNICCSCNNDSKYKEEPKQPEKRCEDCKNLFIDGYSTVCLIRKAACCVNKDKWEPKQTEEQSKQSCENCINENTCSLKCPEHVKANGCRRWAPKQTNDKIKLGDEVIHETGSKGIVIGIGNGTLYLLMREYDMPQKVSKEGYTKTGRYFPQIQELRDQLR